MTPSEIILLRNRLKLTQAQMARDLGVSARTVKRWENGEVEPSPMALKGLKVMAEKVK